MQVQSQVCIPTHTAKSADEKKNSASVAIHRRMMSARCNYGKFGWMTRPNSEWDFIISWTDTFWKEQIGTYTWSLPEIISKSAESKPSNIRGQIHRMGFEHGRKGKDISLDFTQERVQNSRFVFCESTWVLQIESREQCFLCERIHCGLRSFSFVCWGKGIWLQRNRKRFKKSKEPSVTMTKQQYMSVIWTCLFKINCWKNHPRYFRWVKCARTTAIRMNGIQVSHLIFSRMGETSSTPTTTFPWWSQACKQPKTRPELWTTGSRHELWATMRYDWEQNYQNGFFHSRKDYQRDRHVLQTTLQLTWWYHRQCFLFPRILQQNLIQTKQKESTISALGPELRSMQTHESHESAKQNKSWRSGGQNFNGRKIWGRDNSRPQLEKTFQKYKGRVVLVGDTAKDDSVRCMYEARCLSVTYDGGNSHGRYFKITRLFWTKQMMLRAHTHKSKWKTHQNFLIFRKKIAHRFGSYYRMREDHSIGTQGTIQ